MENRWPIEGLATKADSTFAIGRQFGLKQVKHIFRRKRLDLVDGLALNRFHQHRRCRLADTASIAVKPGFGDSPVRIDANFNTDDVSA